jgi:hypothetical protein
LVSHRLQPARPVRRAVRPQIVGPALPRRSGLWRAVAPWIPKQVSTPVSEVLLNVAEPQPTQKQDEDGCAGSDVFGFFRHRPRRPQGSQISSRPAGSDPEATRLRPAVGLVHSLSGSLPGSLPAEPDSASPGRRDDKRDGFSIHPRGRRS